MGQALCGILEGHVEYGQRSGTGALRVVSMVMVSGECSSPYFSCGSWLVCYQACSFPVVALFVCCFFYLEYFPFHFLV